MEIVVLLLYPVFLQFLHVTYWDLETLQPLRTGATVWILREGFVPHLGHFVAHTNTCRLPQWYFWTTTGIYMSSVSVD